MAQSLNKHPVAVYIVHRIGTSFTRTRFPIGWICNEKAVRRCIINQGRGIMKAHIGVLVILTVLCSGILSAQGIGIGPVLGYQKASGADEGNLMLGAALRLKFSPAIGAEGSINYRREKYADGLLTVKSWPVMASALLYPLPNIYGVLGGGWYNTEYEFDRDLVPMVSNKSKQEFGWHLGGGIEFPFSTTSKLTSDLRYVFIDYDIEDIVGLDDKVKSNFVVLTVGLMIGL
jgi:hypothetical protein